MLCKFANLTVKGQNELNMLDVEYELFMYMYIVYL